MLSATAFRSGVVVVGISIVHDNEDPAVWLDNGTRWVRARSRSKSLHEPGLQVMNSVTEGRNGLVAVGFDASGTDRDAAVWTSHDGLRWNRVPPRVFRAPGFEDMEGVAWTKAGYVAAGRDDSPDGRHWEKQAPLRFDDGYPRLAGIAEFHSRLFAFGRVRIHGDVDAIVFPGKILQRS
jgi:hypothetical protein